MTGCFFCFVMYSFFCMQLVACLLRWVVLDPFPPVDNGLLQYLHTTFFSPPEISISLKSFQTIDVFCLFFLMTHSSSPWFLESSLSSMLTFFFTRINISRFCSVIKRNISSCSCFSTLKLGTHFASISENKPAISEKKIMNKLHNNKI